MIIIYWRFLNFNNNITSSGLEVGRCCRVAEIRVQVFGLMIFIKLYFYYKYLLKLNVEKYLFLNLFYIKLLFYTRKDFSSLNF